MKQHAYQIVLLFLLLIGLYVLFKNSSFFEVRSALQDAGVSEYTDANTELGASPDSVLNVNTNQNSGDTLLSRREDLFSQLASGRPYDTYTPDSTSSDSVDKPHYIVSSGYVLNPDSFYLTKAEVKAKAAKMGVGGFIASLASTSAQVKYSSSTGTIEVTTRAVGNYGSKDVLQYTYASEDNGVVFKVDKDWKIDDQTGAIVIQNIGKDGGSKIILTFPKGNTVYTHDSINGDLALRYNPLQSKWTDVTGFTPPVYNANTWLIPDSEKNNIIDTNADRVDTSMDLGISIDTDSVPDTTPSAHAVVDTKIVKSPVPIETSVPNAPTAFAQIVDPLYMTDAGQYVFNGTPRIKTRIIALDINSFVVINLTGTGNTSILDTFIKKVTALSGL